jgi:dienelactone hydrolase
MAWHEQHRIFCFDVIGSQAPGQSKPQPPVITMKSSNSVQSSTHQPMRGPSIGRPPTVVGVWLLMAFWMVAAAQEGEQTPPYQFERVHTATVFGQLYRPTGSSKAPGIIVLGGSGGRLNHAFSEQLARAGFVVLALAYFNAPDRPSTLDRVPVETVSHGIDWLLAQPGVQPSGVGLLAVSRGTELAFLAAAHDPRIQAVAALVPSSVAWQGQRGPVAWTLGGQAVATLTLPPVAGQSNWQRVHQALQTEQAAQARLPVQLVNGPVLLVSATRDHIWPSTSMAEALLQQLQGHAHDHTHLKLDDDHTLGPDSQAQLAGSLLGLFKQMPVESASH